MTKNGVEFHHSNQDPLAGMHVNIEEANARLAKYRPLIDELLKKQTPERFEALSLHAPISKNFWTYDNFVSPGLRRKLQDTVLVDIGAGYASNIRNLARDYSVPFLIEIEKFYSNQKTGWEDVSEEGLHIIRFRSDILEVLVRLPSASANVIMNGIDHLIIPRGQYRTAMLQEIVRVVPPAGIFFGYGSDMASTSPYGPFVDVMPTGFVETNLLGGESALTPKFFIFEREQSK